MKVIRWLIGLPLAVVAIVFAVANRDPVTVELWPFPWTATLPLYLLSLGTLAVGMIVGGLLAWASGGRRRAQTRRERKGQERKIQTLERENATLKEETIRLAAPADEQKSLPPAA
ncbi:LapA family protein [Caenispirillum bisanense]|uniref:LapA family protein n=1 Tax=Caenispirillum bisanense TaxID=414052 RepID=UPI0031DD3034